METSNGDELQSNNTLEVDNSDVFAGFLGGMVQGISIIGARRFKKQLSKLFWRQMCRQWSSLQIDLQWIKVDGRCV